MKLKPCPFCGSNSVTIRLIKADDVRLFRDRYAVTCDYNSGGCGAESGWGYSTAEATRLWNTRSRLGQPSVRATYI